MHPCDSNMKLERRNLSRFVKIVLLRIIRFYFENRAHAINRADNRLPGLFGHQIKSTLMAYVNPGTHDVRGILNLGA